MAVLSQASHQWASRPADERFCSLTDLHEHNTRNRWNSKQVVVSNRKIEVQPVYSDDKPTGQLVLMGKAGNPAEFSHWSFGQTSVRSNSPANYLRTLPAPLAADCINWGLMNRDVEECGLMVRKNEDSDKLSLACMTGPNYGRIWNDQISKALIDRFGDGITGDFRVPGEFGEKIEVTKANTTLYASDRDMFVFLADEEHRIDMPNRRDGKSGSLARGFFVWNSEVGSQTFGIATFLFDYVCCNRMVWGAQQFKEIKMRHTSGAPDRFLEQAMPAIRKYADSETNCITDALKLAQNHRIGDEDKVTEFLMKRFTKSETKGIKDAHFIDEQRPIETLWDAATGITAFARGVKWTDERVDLERKAGAVLDLVF